MPEWECRLQYHFWWTILKKNNIIIQFNSSYKEKSKPLEFHDLSIPVDTAVLRCGANQHCFIGHVTVFRLPVYTVDLFMLLMRLLGHWISGPHRWYQHTWRFNKSLPPGSSIIIQNRSNQSTCTVSKTLGKNEKCTAVAKKCVPHVFNDEEDVIAEILTKLHNRFLWGREMSLFFHTL